MGAIQDDRLVRAIELLTKIRLQYDHAQDCNAWHGPPGEQWKIEEDCDCGLVETRAFAKSEGIDCK